MNYMVLVKLPWLCIHRQIDNLIESSRVCYSRMPHQLSYKDVKQKVVVFKWIIYLAHDVEM